MPDFLFLEVDGRAEDDATLGVERRRVDDLRGRELALDLEDAALDEALLVLGRLVLGVLGQVALGARLGDRLDDGMTLDALQARELFLQLFEAASGERDGGHGNLGKKKTAARQAPAAASWRGSLVQLRMQFLQRSDAQVVAMLHALDRRLAARHAGVVGDAVGQRRLADVARVGDRRARLVDGGEDELDLACPSAGRRCAAARP